MTRETRLSIEPKDIERIVFECSDCGGGLSVPGGGDVTHGDRLTNCPSCGKDWLANYTQAEPFRKFMQALKTLRDTAAPFSVRLEVSESEPRR